MHVIPQSWSHLHILVSVFPSVGLLFVLGFYIAALITANEVMKRICLVLIAILALLAIPTYFSGDYPLGKLRFVQIGDEVVSVKLRIDRRCFSGRFHTQPKEREIAIEYAT